MHVLACDLIVCMLLSGEHGLHRSDLVNWYLGEVEDDIESEQDLIDTKLLVEMVIDRLIKHVSSNNAPTIQSVELHHYRIVSSCKYTRRLH